MDEIADLRKTQANIRSLHLELFLMHTICMESQPSREPTKLDSLLSATRILLDLGTDVIDHISPKLGFIQYVEAVETVRREQGDLVAGCRIMLGLFLKDGCGGESLQKKYGTIL